MNFCSGVLLPKSMNLLAKVGYNLAKVISFGKTSYDLAKPLYYLAKVGSFAKLYRVLLNSTKESHIYDGGYYKAADQCTTDLLQIRKPMDAGLSDKTTGSIISVLPVCVSYYQAAHKAGNQVIGADKGQRYFVVIEWDIWYTFHVAESDKPEPAEVN